MRLNHRTGDGFPSEGRRRQTEEGSGDAAGGGGEDLLAQGELFGGHAPHAEPATGLRFKRLLHVCCVLRVCVLLQLPLACCARARPCRVRTCKRITRNTSQRAPIPGAALLPHPTNFVSRSGSRSSNYGGRPALSSPVLAQLGLIASTRPVWPVLLLHFIYYFYFIYYYYLERKRKRRFRSCPTFIRLSSLEC